MSYSDSASQISVDNHPEDFGWNRKSERSDESENGENDEEEQEEGNEEEDEQDEENERDEEDDEENEQSEENERDEEVEDVTDQEFERQVSFSQLDIKYSHSFNLFRATMMTADTTSWRKTSLLCAMA